MRKRIATFSAVLLAAGVIYQLDSTVTAPGAARISYPNSGGACSAVVISDTEALTAAHCMADTTVANGMYMVRPIVVPVVLHQDGKKALAILTYMSRIRDLAVLKGDFRAFTRPPGIAGRTFMALGERYRSCGFPMGQKSLFCIELGEYITSDIIMFVFKQPILFGMSGGPVYNSQNELVGLNTAIYPREMGGGSAITPILGLEGEIGR